MNESITTPPPAALRSEGRRLWASIADQWADDGLVPDARELRLLEDACREADVLDVLQGALDTALEAGELLVKGSMGQPVAHPMIAEARRSRQQIATLLGKLGLEAADASVVVPGTGLTVTEAGRRGGMARRHGRDGLGPI